MPEPIPIRLANLREWVAKTRALDDELYAAAPRPRTLRRVAASLLPRVRAPVFVLGAPRSGTSFLGDAVGALPELSYHYEPPLTKAASRYVHERLWSEWKARLLYRGTYAWLLARHLDGDLRFAEKTPQNCFALAFLARAFPDARFLHVLRDGRDAALSLAAKTWLSHVAAGSGRRETGGYLLGPYARYWVEPERRAEFESTTDLHRCIWSWRRHVEAALGAGRALPSARYLEVRYEQLVQDPRAVAARIAGFLGVTREESRAALEERLLEADDRSVGRWRRELRSEEAACVEREAGALLRDLGYAPTPAEVRG